MCHDNEEWIKIWRGIALSVQNWHEEFDEFWAEHSKISRIWILRGCFWPKYIMFQLKKCIGVMLLAQQSKMAELNQNKNSKQPHWPDAVWKLYFNLEINK